LDRKERIWNKGGKGRWREGKEREERGKKRREGKGEVWVCGGGVVI
jgi:hypothetical protein